MQEETGQVAEDEGNGGGWGARTSSQRAGVEASLKKLLEDLNE